MADTVRSYGGPLVLALLVHVAAVTALYDGWIPGAQPESRVIRPNLVQSQLIVMQPKAPPKPKPAPPRPTAETPAAEPAPQAQPEPRRDLEAEALEAQRRQQEAAQALERQQRRLAELAQDSFAQALAEEASELAADQDPERRAGLSLRHLPARGGQLVASAKRPQRHAGAPVGRADSHRRRGRCHCG